MSLWFHRLIVDDASANTTCKTVRIRRRKTSGSTEVDLGSLALVKWVTQLPRCQPARNKRASFITLCFSERKGVEFARWYEDLTAKLQVPDLASS